MLDLKIFLQVEFTTMSLFLQEISAISNYYILEECNEFHSERKTND